VAAIGGVPSGPELLLPGAAILLGALLLLIGALLAAVRAVIVRADLPPDRYRGPGIFVLSLLAVVGGTIPALFAFADAAALFGEGTPTIVGSLVLLTSTQIGLLAVTGALVIWPRALVGVRLVGPAGAGRSVLLGLGLVLPAWIVATLLGLLAAVLLELVGVRPQPQVVEQAILELDPTVVLVAFLLIAPVAEELFFRGVVYSAWEREYGPDLALFGSAALFAAIHFELAALLPIFGLGLLLGVVYRRTRSLLTVISLHAGFNAISVGLTLADRLGLIHLPT